MKITIDIAAETFPIAGAFVISRGSKTEAQVVMVTITDGMFSGRGECVPYARYDESVASVIADIKANTAFLIDRPDRTRLQTHMKAGAARNALDCALWDFEAKRLGIPAKNSLSVRHPKPVTTAYTLSLGTPAEMEAAAKAAAHRPLLKIKVGGEGDIERQIGRASCRERV